MDIYQYIKNGVKFKDVSSVTIDETVVLAKDTEIGKDVVIKGNSQIGENTFIGDNTYINDSIIGKNCKIQISYIEESEIENNINIGPFAHLRKGCFVESNCKIGNFVELKNSKLGPYCKVAHLTYIGDADIGINANIGCGVVFINYDGKNKFRTRVGNNVFIGSNSNIIAPVIIGNECFIAAGTTVTQDLDAKDFCIGRVRQEVKKNYKNKYTEGIDCEKQELYNKSKKYFGTDGIRGIYGGLITENLIYICGLALSKVTPCNKVVIGRDTRASGNSLKSSLMQAFVENKVEVVDLGITTTPAVAYMAKVENADFAVVITASHNTSEYNGLKFFGKNGKKLLPAEESKLDSLIQSLEHIEYIENKEKESIISNCDKYISYLLNHCDIDLNGLKVVLDCSNGASMELAPKVFELLGANVVSINTDKNDEINQDCGCLHMEKIQEAVIKNNANVGFAFDGDADRILATDHLGKVFDGDDILYTIARHYKKVGILKNDLVVSTIQSNLSLKNSLKIEGIDLLTTDVGDKYVLEKMLETGAIVGGEQSGHIILGDMTQTGDGIMTAIQLASIMIYENKNLDELCNLKHYPQLQKSFLVEHKDLLLTNEIIRNEVSKCEKELDIYGRVLLRASGTEPKVRLLVEAEDEKNCDKVFNHLVTVIKNYLTTQP